MIHLHRLNVYFVKTFFTTLVWLRCWPLKSPSNHHCLFYWEGEEPVPPHQLFLVWAEVRRQSLKMSSGVTGPSEMGELTTASWCSWWSTSARSRAAARAGGRSKRWPVPPPGSVPWRDLSTIHSAERGGRHRSGFIAVHRSSFFYITKKNHYSDDILRVFDTILWAYSTRSKVESLDHTTQIQRSPFSFD